MATLKSLLCLLLLVVSGHSSSETLVPFIAWSNGGVLSSLSSKQPSTVDDFLESSNLKDVDLFVVFKTSKLSFDDIAKYGGVYGEKHSALATLQSELQSAGSTLWTGMQGHPASSLVSSLSFNYDLDAQDVIGADDISLDGSGKQLIVVLLPDDDNEERAFLEQDKVISEVMSTITSSQKSFTAFYTGDSATPVGPQMQVFQFKRQAGNEVSDGVGEEANSSSTTCAFISAANLTTNGGRCVMMCLTTPIHMVDLFPSGSVHNYSNRADTIRFVNGSCLDGNVTDSCDVTRAPYFNVEFTFNNSETINFKFTFLQGTNNCSLSQGFWTIDLESEDGTKYVRNTQGRIFSKFEVPIGASYACGKNGHNIFRRSRGNETFTQDAIMFSGIQAQVGGMFTETSFASAYNCVSYFSHISLMGIFTILILVVVLYCSTVFMFQMKSMDRFDDPRGPTITVENLH